jgi:hypothetical protein
MEELKRLKERNEREEPKFTASRTESAEPTRTNERIETLLPMVMKSIKLKLQPARMWPAAKLMLLPIRA